MSEKESERKRNYKPPSSASRHDVNGVCSEDLRTTVLPTLIAIAIFITASRRGKFHAVISPITPIGSRIT